MIDLPSRRRSGKARLHQQHRKESQLRFHTHHKAFAFPFFRISFGSFFIIVTVLSPFNLYFLLFLLSPSHHHLSIFHEIKIIKLNSQWQTDWRGRFKWWRGEERGWEHTTGLVYESKKLGTMKKKGKWSDIRRLLCLPSVTHTSL